MIDLSASGANPIMKTDKERPEACWACEGAVGGSRHALPSEGRGCWLCGMGLKLRLGRCGLRWGRDGLR